MYNCDYSVIYAAQLLTPWGWMMYVSINFASGNLACHLYNTKLLP